MRFWRQAVVAFVATVAAWFTSWRVADAANLGSGVIILATVLSNSLARQVARERPRSWKRRAVRLVTVPVVAVVATEVGQLLAHHKWWGGSAFALVMAGSVWIRRFGSPWSAVGSLVASPFIALLIAPISPREAHTLWPAAIAVMALLWVVVVQQVAWAIGFVGRPPYSRTAPSQTGWLPASTKMAVQMGVALAVAYVLGRWWYPEHWTWMLLSAFVVCAGNAGRGDVLHKGLMRLMGALVGTASATVLASAFDPGDRTGLVILFVVLFFSIWGREVNYALWAAGVTAMVSLLYGYYGQGGTDVLLERLVSVALGAVVGVVVSWLVLPVHSRDVFRRRWADALAAVSELLTALRTGPDGVPAAHADLAHAVRQLEVIEPAWRLHAWALKPGSGNPAELVALLRDVRRQLDQLADLPPAELVEHRDTVVAWAQQLGAIRRRMRGETSEPSRAADVGVGPIDEASWALERLDADFDVDAWERLRR